MAASKPKRTAPQHHDIPTPEAPKTSKKPRKNHSTLVSPEQQAPTPGSSKSTEDSQWLWRPLTQSNSGRAPLLFTKDGSYFFSANGPSVKIYSVSTGRVISTLYPPQSYPTGSIFNPKDAVTCMVLNPHNAFQLITGSLDGFIRVWDFVDAVLLRVYDLSKPIHHLAVHERFKDEVLVSVARAAKRLNSRGNPIANGDNNTIFRLTLKPTEATLSTPIQKPVACRQVGKTRGTSGLAFSPSGAWLVATAGHKAYVASTSSLDAGFTKFVSPEKLTCLAFHPSEEYFATGDEKGVVRLWYCLNESFSADSNGTEKKAPTTTLHWHAHAVASLAFTANGAYLLTGGEEAVLVIWQLHTGRKEFVPRLGVPIADVAVTKNSDGEEEYLVSLADASFVFVRSGTLKISRTIARIKIDPAISNNRPISPSSVPLAVHSLTSTLILPSSHPTMIQVLAPSTTNLISEIEVSPSNKVSRRDDKMLEPPRVERAAISDSGRWMATVDTRSGDEKFRGEVYLKLWSWDRNGGFWSLNTRIDRPHGLGRVTAAVFRPSREDGGEQLVTSGADGTTKVWRLHQAMKGGKTTEEFWVAQATITFRSETPTDASWSADGSLLAVSLGPYIGLYDAGTDVLFGTFSCPECLSFTSAQFVGPSSRYLAAFSSRDLVVWDIISHTLWWHYRSPSTITRLIARTDADEFVVFEKPPATSGHTTKVLSFMATSPVPTSTCTLPFHLLGVLACPPTWMQPSADPRSLGLVMINESWDVVLLGNGINLPEEEGAKPVGLKDPTLPPKRTLFQDIFGVSPIATDALLSRQKPATLATTWKGKDVERIFDAPAYLMPSLDSLFDPLMQSFLTIRVSGKAKAEDPGEEVDQAGEEMEIVAEDTLILVGNRLERTVDNQELAGLVDLFKSHSTRHPKPAPNGVQKQPGTGNGSTTRPPLGTPTTKSKNATPTRREAPVLSPTSKPVQGIPPPTPAPMATSPTVRTGQKRKKSFGIT